MTELQYHIINNCTCRLLYGTVRVPLCSCTRLHVRKHAQRYESSKVLSYYSCPLHVRVHVCAVLRLRISYLTNVCLRGIDSRAVTPRTRARCCHERRGGKVNAREVRGRIDHGKPSSRRRDHDASATRALAYGAIVEEEGNHVLVGGDPRRGRKREKRSESRGFAARLEQKWRFTIRLSYDDDDENDKYFVTSILTTSSPRFTTAPFQPNINLAGQGKSG